MEKASAEDRRGEAAHRRRKEWAVLGSGLTLGGLICLVCLVVIMGPGHSDELRKAAMSGLFALVLASFAYVAGKAGSKD